MFTSKKLPLVKFITLSMLVMFAVTGCLFSTTVPDDADEPEEDVLLDITFDNEEQARDLFNFVGKVSFEDDGLVTETLGEWESSGIVNKAPFQVSPIGWLVIETHVTPIATSQDSPLITSVVDSGNIHDLGLFAFISNAQGPAVLYATDQGQQVNVASQAGIVTTGAPYIIQIWYKPGEVKLVVKSESGVDLYESTVMNTKEANEVTVLFGDKEAAAGTGKSKWKRIKVFRVE